MFDVVVLFSGGLDSMALAYMAYSAGRLDTCLFVDYGQASADQEHAAAEWWCDRHAVRLLRVVCPLAGLEEMSAPSGEPGPRIVPGRNMALIALGVNEAMAIAKRQGRRCSEVWIGCTAEDRDSYPDCRQAFINPLGPIIEKAYGVDVRAPFLHTFRADIINRARAKGWDLGQSWSCYNPDATGNPCGGCNSCQQQRPD